MAADVISRLMFGESMNMLKLGHVSSAYAIDGVELTRNRNRSLLRLLMQAQPEALPHQVLCRCDWTIELPACTRRMIPNEVVRCAR